MAFSGLDLSRGFERYADLLAQAARDKAEMDAQAQQRAFSNRMSAQQGNVLYGYDGPEVNYVPSPVPLPQMPQEAAYTNDVGMPEQFQRSPNQANDFSDELEATNLLNDLQSGQLDRVKKPQTAPQKLQQAALQGAVKQNTQAVQAGSEDPTMQRSDKIVSYIDQMIAQALSSPGVIRGNMIRPDVARQIQKLQEMKIEAMSKSENNLYNQMIMEALRQQGRKDLAASRPRSTIPRLDPRVSIYQKDIDALQREASKLTGVAQIIDPNAAGRLEEIQARIAELSAQRDALAGIGEAPKKKTYKVGSQILSEEEFKSKYPQSYKNLKAKEK